MNKTVGSVLDDINEWEGQHGTVYYVTCFFTDGDVGSVGRKDQDAALEVQGLLREAIEQEMDFELEPNGTTKSGKRKFKIRGFGTPGGAATYTAPGVQGGGGSGNPVPSRSRSPEHDHYIQERMDRRTALMQAVSINGEDFVGTIRYANEFYIWLRETSEPASSEDERLAPNHTAGAGSETTSPVAGSEGVTLGRNAERATPAGDTQSAVSAADGGQVVDGEASTCPPHDLDLDVAPKAMRYPCRKCGFWVKPTMAAEEAEEAAR